MNNVEFETKRSLIVFLSELRDRSKDLQAVILDNQCGVDYSIALAEWIDINNQLILRLETFSMLVAARPAGDSIFQTI